MNPCLGARTQIPLKSQFLLWFAGLRGAIAYGLAKQWQQEESVNHIETCVMLVVVFTTFGLGGMFGWVIKKLDYEDPTAPAGRGPTTSTYDYVHESMTVALDDAIADDQGFAAMLRRLDNEWLAPVLGGECHQQVAEVDDAACNMELRSLNATRHSMEDTPRDSVDSQPAASATI